MVLLGKTPKTEGQVRLTAMQLKKNPKKEKLIFVATITSSKEENDAKKSLPMHEEGSKREQCCDTKEVAETLATQDGGRS